MNMEGKGVLLIATKQRLVVVDLRELEKLKIPAVPERAVKVFNFVENGFPFAASFFLLESKLYAFGGERTRVGLSEDRLLSSSTTNLDESSGTRGLSRKIYVSDLTTMTDSITRFDDHCLTMQAPKTSPIIEEIEGKIYVLAGPSFHYKDFMPIPAFEVYDPSLHRFETLPTPPFYSRKNYTDPDCIIHGHSVVGTTIYVRAGEKYYSYSIRRREWDYLGKSADEIPLQEHLLPGNNGKFVPAYEDILISFSHDELFAVLLTPDGGDPLIQSLDEVYKDDSTVFWKGEGVVVAMGEHEMCFIRPKALEFGNEVMNRIDVATFRVEKLNSSVSNSLTSHNGGNCHTT